MCGIYGILNLTTDAPPGAALISGMGRVVMHRGPDDEGLYCGRGIALGMRRLSIIDLSGGHQPISNEVETIWVVCNGEIYNFQELRDRLESQGHIFRTKSDTEVIEKVLPGHMLICELGRIRDQEYWDGRFDRTEKRSEGDWIEQIRDKFLEAVKLRLISDVPLGAFLSGGIDSSAVVAAMARLTNRPVKTYSIGFEGDDQFYNELPYARMVADAFATDHHEIIVRPEVSELLPKLIWHMDEPIADSALITTFLVSRLARESVTVILSGVGGDELFGGYRRYLSDNLRRHYQRLPGVLRKKWLPAIFSHLPQDRHSGWKNNIRYSTAFMNTAEQDRVSRYVSYVGVFSPDLRSRLMRSDSLQVTSETLRHYFSLATHADGLNQLIYVDIKTSLPDDLLLLTDKMTMAASIECRAPFMDADLVDLTSRMPSELKVHGLSMKYLLKKAVQPWLPAAILQRKKRGFGAPVGSWFRKDLDFLVQETLSESQIRKRGIFDPAVIQDIISTHRAQRSDHTDHLLALINLELWSRIFLDGLAWRQVQSASEVVTIGR